MEIVEGKERSVVETQAEARGLRVACKTKFKCKTKFRICLTSE